MVTIKNLQSNKVKIFLILFLCLEFQFGMSQIEMPNNLIKTIPDEYYNYISDSYVENKINSFNIYLLDSITGKVKDTIKAKQITEYYSFKNGQKNGLFYQVANDSILMVKGVYFKNKLHGILTCFDFYVYNPKLKSQNIYFEEIYYNGELDGITRFYSKGRNQIDYHYNKGSLVKKIAYYNGLKNSIRTIEYFGKNDFFLYSFYEDGRMKIAMKKKFMSIRVFFYNNQSEIIRIEKHRRGRFIKVIYSKDKKQLGESFLETWRIY